MNDDNVPKSKITDQFITYLNIGHLIYVINYKTV